MILVILLNIFRGVHIIQFSCTGMTIFYTHNRIFKTFRLILWYFLFIVNLFTYMIIIWTTDSAQNFFRIQWIHHWIQIWNIYYLINDELHLTLFFPFFSYHWNVVQIRKKEKLLLLLFCLFILICFISMHLIGIGWQNQLY